MARVHHLPSDLNVVTHQHIWQPFFMLVLLPLWCTTFPSILENAHQKLIQFYAELLLYWW